MSDDQSTRSQFRPDLRRHARLAVEIYRHGATLPQLIAIARIRVRLAASGARHELRGGWERDAAALVDVITCARCGRQARVYLETGADAAGEFLEACRA